MMATPETCPFCDFTPVPGPKAHGSINRHIKLNAKPGKKFQGKHPELGSELYIEVARQRNFRSRVREGEKRRRLAKTKKRCEEIRKKCENIKTQRVLNALEQLRYLFPPGGDPWSPPYCFLILTSIRTDFTNSRINKPYDLPVDAHFSELVFYFLPEMDWYKSPSIFPGSQMGSEAYTLDRYHYNLLSAHPYCNKQQLKVAWTEWLRLGTFRRGNILRLWLHDGSFQWISTCKLYDEIQRGVFGTAEEKKLFHAKWLAKGMEEIEKWGEERGMTWCMFDDVKENLYEETKRHV